MKYIEHRAFIRNASARVRRERVREDAAVIAEQKVEVDGQEKIRLKRSMWNRENLTAATHCLNGTKLSWE